MSIQAKILLVEDHVASAKSLARLLALHGYEVRTADDYRSAKVAATAERFNLLLCDIELPDGNGCDLLMELRGLCGLDGIAVSGHGMPEDLKRSREAGFLFHVTKPVDFERLRSAVEEAIARRTATPHEVGFQASIATGS